MKTLLVQRKFGISSQFLDTTLQKEGEVREGETEDDALIRMYRELGVTADRIQKEHAISAGQYTVAADNTPQFNQPLPTISKDKEPGSPIDLITEIESCKKIKVLESYRIIVKKNPYCEMAYEKRMTELLAERPTEFSEGLT